MKTSEQIYILAVFIAVSLLLGILRIIILQRRLSQREYEFINVVTHTFRTPTSVIKWSLDNLRKSDYAQFILEDTNQIESSNERVIALLDTLTSFSSLVSEEHYVFGAVSVREMLEEILKKYGQKIREKNIALTVEIPLDTPLISGDTKRLQFVFEVLVQNAIMYTPANGQMYVAAYKDKKHLKIVVKDSGIGIARKEKRHLFVQFYRSHRATTTDTQGLGLGLFVAKKIINKHKGKLWVESAGENKGSTFFVKLKL